MGLAGGPHCLAMCGAACGGIARACGGGRDAQARHTRWALFSLLSARLLSYALGGAVAAASVGALARVSAATTWLHPLWVMVHLAAALLGLSLAWSGRQPAWLEQAGRWAEHRFASASRSDANVVHVFRPGRAAAFGMAWVAWPCGLLQSALVVAGLAPSSLDGAVVMALFALGSGVSLWLGPALWLRLSGHAQAQSWAIRAAGVMLAAASGWALWHDMWLRYGPPVCT